MRFMRFIGFSLVRAWQGFWRNAMMSLATTATVVLMLVLLSGLVIVLTGLDFGLQFIERKVSVRAELVDDLPTADLERLLADTRELPGVASVAYVSPEEALQRLRESYRERGEQFQTGGADIQLQAGIEIELADASRSTGVSEALSTRPEVAKITTKQADYEKLLGIINVVRTVGLAVIALVGLTVLFMIVNTVRIAVYSRQNEIEIMRLVGASDSFIRWPFILEGVLCGLIGALVTVFLVAVVWGPIQPWMVSVFQMPTSVSTRFPATLSALVLGVGLALGALASYISVRSYLSTAR